MDQFFLKKRLFWNSFSLPLLIESLNNDEISIVGTDTILGFLGNITNKSFKLLNNIKGKRNDKPYLILVSNLDKIYKFVDTEDVSKKILNMISKCWPGPVTFVFKAKQDLPDFLKSTSGTIALRCPNHLKLLEVLSFFDGLFSTSANKTVEPAPSKIEEINVDLLSKIKFIIDNSKFDLEKFDYSLQKLSDLPSTILDCAEYDKVKVLREGAYPIEKLEELYGRKFER